MDDFDPRQPTPSFPPAVVSFLFPVPFRSVVRAFLTVIYAQPENPRLRLFLGRETSLGFYFYFSLLGFCLAYFRAGSPRWEDLDGWFLFVGNTLDMIRRGSDGWNYFDYYYRCYRNSICCDQTLLHCERKAIK